MIMPYFLGMNRLMELRHLRYFVAVAEEGSLTHAAERRLHTAQPSLSRQIRDLELEVGVELFVRSSRGIELTEAGRVFLDYVRLALLQVDAAGDAARRAAQPAKASFVLGFLPGHEVTWLPDALRILRDEFAQHRGDDIEPILARIGRGSAARGGRCGVSSARGSGA